MRPSNWQKCCYLEGFFLFFKVLLTSASLSRDFCALWKYMLNEVTHTSIMAKILSCSDAGCSSNEVVRCARETFRRRHCLVCKTSQRMNSAILCSCIATHTKCRSLLCHSQCACEGKEDTKVNARDVSASAVEK